MARTTSAKRHAQAVFELALERDELELWRLELRQIRDTIKDPRLRALLESPRLGFEDKIELLSQPLAGISPLARNLAYLLVSKNRLGLVDQMVAEYERLVDEHYGIEPATVTSAVPLDDEERQQVAGRLEALVEKQVRLEARLDPSIIGGLVARVGDRLLDGSIRTRLRLLKENLLKAQG